MPEFNTEELMQTLYDRVLIAESKVQILIDAVVPIIMEKSGKSEVEVCADLTERGKRALQKRQADDPLFKGEWDSLLGDLGLEGPNHE